MIGLIWANYWTDIHKKATSMTNLFIVNLARTASFANSDEYTRYVRAAPCVSPKSRCRGIQPDTNAYGTDDCTVWPYFRIQMTIVGPDRCLILVDKNKLMKIVVMEINSQSLPKRVSNQTTYYT